MNVTLSETFENYIKQQLASGTYNNASEVIGEALHLKMKQDELHQAKISALRTALTEGEQSGASSGLDMDEIIREARREVNA